MSAIAFLYGLICYGIFFLTFLYAIGFIGNFGVPRTIDTGFAPTPTAVAIVVNLALLSVFAIQHSVMARQGFKKVWTKIVPASVERSTYVLLSSLALILLFWQWRPMPALVWDVQNELGRNVLWAMFGFGWLLVLVSTFLINHFELFGLSQVWRNLKQQPAPEMKFREPFLYKIVRHPLYVGWFFTFWAIPTMTVGHLLFAAVASAYIVVAIQFEERDLMKFHPEYAGYRERVPMLIPGTGRKRARD